MKEVDLEGLNLDTSKFNNRPLRLEVYDFLKEAIIKGRLAPGQKLNELDFSRHLGVSRTPVREALIRLQQEGLVDIDPRKGAAVCEVSKHDLAEIYTIVSTLEGLAARLAAPEILPEDIRQLRELNKRLLELGKKPDEKAFLDENTDFHEIYLSRCPNVRLRSLISNWKEQIYRFRLFSLKVPKRMEQSVEEHEEIIDAFEQGLPERAEQLVRRHVDRGRLLLQEVKLEEMKGDIS